MKKVKIMLTSIAVLAVVGGALAFKARFNQKICTMPTIDGTCPTNTLDKNFCPVKDKITLTDVGVLVCTTTTTRTTALGFCDPTDCNVITITVGD